MGATTSTLIILGGVALVYYAIFSAKGLLGNNSTVSSLTPLNTDQWSDTVDRHPTGTGTDTGGMPQNGDYTPPTIPTGASYATQRQAFLDALAAHESGGSYTARNNTTGAYGKYQVLPKIWDSWSRQYLGYVAPETPANQEFVVGHVIDDMYTSYQLHRTEKQPSFANVNPWILVAAAWHSGRGYVKSTPYSQFSVRTQKYVYRVIRSMVGNLS